MCAIKTADIVPFGHCNQLNVTRAYTNTCTKKPAKCRNLNADQRTVVHTKDEKKCNIQL